VRLIHTWEDNIKSNERNHFGGYAIKLSVICMVVGANNGFFRAR
jgi:hypothetical protein